MFQVSKQLAHKMKGLYELLNTLEYTQALVFSNYKSRAESIYLDLKKQGECWHIGVFFECATTIFSRLRLVCPVHNQ